MKNKYNYPTSSEAIKELKHRGFTLDFNLEKNCIACHHEKFKAKEFKIVEIYRYEGNPVPADEATVYAIETRSGKKGFLLIGYGVCIDTISTEILDKLQIIK